MVDGQYQMVSNILNSSHKTLKGLSLWTLKGDISEFALTCEMESKSASFQIQSKLVMFPVCASELATLILDDIHPLVHGQFFDLIPATCIKRTTLPYLDS